MFLRVTSGRSAFDRPGILSSVAIDPLIERQRLRDLARSTESIHGPAVVERPAGRRPWRVWRRRTGLVVTLLLVVVLHSYTVALTGPGTDSLQARSVEWARDHHLGRIVDRLEKYWYEHHQAKVGGTPKPIRAPDRPSVAAADPAAAGIPNVAPALSGPGVPAALRSPAAGPVPNEGVWTALGPTNAGRSGAYMTMIRPDAVHTSVLDAVVEFDPKVVSFRQYPGTKIPGAPWDRPDHVEPQRQPQLLAAFAGGFRLRDSNGGMLLGGRELQPMRIGAATLAIDANGVATVGEWGRDIPPTSVIDSARQNLDLIVDNGAVVANLATDPNRTWGFTGPANKSAVWRSGAGVTPSGALVWVGGEGLTITALAETLVRAGVVRGMQLEINQEWVQFNTYAVTGSGIVNGMRLLPGMQHTGNRWLTEDTRDFVAVFARPSPPT